MHLAKKGIRVCGIAESFSGRERSTLAGVVMRKDMIIDGAAFARVTVGGSDATQAVLEIFRTLNREDIACLMVSGCVIAWFNIIDPDAIRDSTGLPLIAVTYEESEGLAGDIAHHFPGDAERLAAYTRLGQRVPVALDTGYRLFIRAWGMEVEEAARICNAFTLEGRVPEPVRIARIIARAAMRLEGGG